MLNDHLLIYRQNDFDAFDYDEKKGYSNFSILLKYPCKSTSICKSIDGLIKPGVYLFEVWGAQGGNGSHTDTNKINEGARGGYSSAIFKISHITPIFLYIGGKGTDAQLNRWEVSPGGFNGGGAGGFDGAKKYGSGGGGGGGTDIRLVYNDYQSRVIVAGGAGGS